MDLGNEGGVSVGDTPVPTPTTEERNTHDPGGGIMRTGLRTTHQTPSLRLRLHAVLSCSGGGH